LDTAEILERLAEIGPLEFDAGSDLRGAVRIGSPSGRPIAVPRALIDGRPVPSGSRTFERRNPSNWNEVLVQVGLARAKEVAHATETAAEAQRDWGRVLPSRRAALLEEWAAALEARELELARLIPQETGKPIADAREEIGRAIDLVRAAA